MTKPRLIYFDFPGSRGEECRLALHCAGVDFEDLRIDQQDWKTRKASTPFGALPVLEISGKKPLAQTHAILVLVGRKHGLHPEDVFAAALHEAMMCHAEALRDKVGTTLRVGDDEKKALRQELLASYFPQWSRAAEAQIGEGPFFEGSALQVVDIKLYMVVRWFVESGVDHIPTSVFDDFPKLLGVYKAVKNDARIQAWYTKTS